MLLGVLELLLHCVVAHFLTIFCLDITLYLEVLLCIREHHIISVIISIQVVSSITKSHAHAISILGTSRFPLHKVLIHNLLRVLLLRIATLIALVQLLIHIVLLFTGSSLEVTQYVGLLLLFTTSYCVISIAYLHISGS